MNPWGLLILGLGVVLIIVGFTGSQHRLASAILGHPGSNAPSGSQYPQKTSTATPTPPVTNT